MRLGRGRRRRRLSSATMAFALLGAGGVGAVGAAGAETASAATGSTAHITVHDLHVRSACATVKIHLKLALNAGSGSEVLSSATAEVTRGHSLSKSVTLAIAANQKKAKGQFDYCAKKDGFGTFKVSHVTGQYACGTCSSGTATDHIKGHKSFKVLLATHARSHHPQSDPTKLEAGFTAYDLHAGAMRPVGHAKATIQSRKSKTGKWHNVVSGHADGQGVIAFMGLSKKRTYRIVFPATKRTFEADTNPYQPA